MVVNVTGTLHSYICQRDHYKSSDTHSTSISNVSTAVSYLSLREGGYFTHWCQDNDNASTVIPLCGGGFYMLVSGLSGYANHV